MTDQAIIMNFTTPPSQEDILALAKDILNDMPEDLLEVCDHNTISIKAEEIADNVLLDQLDIEDGFELACHYDLSDENRKNITAKHKQSTPTLTLFRRAILDAWCDTQEDIAIIMRHIIFTEIGQVADLDDAYIDEIIHNYDLALAS